MPGKISFSAPKREDQAVERWEAFDHVWRCRCPVLITKQFGVKCRLFHCSLVTPVGHDSQQYALLTPLLLTAETGS
jgi:hypothetical protein